MLFGFTPETSKARYIGTTRSREEQGLLSMSHAVGVTRIPSNLLCRGPQQLLSLKKPTASTAAMDLPQVALCFVPQVFLFPASSRLNLSYFIPHSSIRTWDLQPAAIPVPCCRVGMKCQPGPQKLTPTAIHACSWLPSSCALGGHWPASHHQPLLLCIHPW